MKRLLIVPSLLLLLAAGCYGPDREPGDDPNRSDETPGEGRPKTDARDTVDQPGPSGGVVNDANTPADGRGTLDGSSDEVGTPER